ncbi:phenylacetaldoxime dehydratase family protein [Chlorogloeopsis sp. ULAP02]|uniref:phenylacetaldoxime dehydratase family protein n=1 Tax=Chlorogloeopsis sp. ULAP02 TaxID=3107926 RepID=UPI0031361277
MSEIPTEQTYIAALWEQPTLCLAFFGVQFHTKEGQRLYQQSGIQDEMFPALEAARSEGLLLTRQMMTEEGPVSMQYWRSYADLDQWARHLPHSRWWQWLTENAGKGLGFYHEIYQVKTAEALYERGTKPVGPAVFCSLHSVKNGEGKSKERQQHFVGAANEAERIAKQK